MDFAYLFLEVKQVKLHKERRSSHEYGTAYCQIP